jgi:hypothetical protein
MVLVLSDPLGVFAPLELNSFAQSGPQYNRNWVTKTVAGVNMAQRPIVEGEAVDRLFWILGLHLSGEDMLSLEAYVRYSSLRDHYIFEDLVREVPPMMPGNVTRTVVAQRLRVDGTITGFGRFAVAIEMKSAGDPAGVEDRRPHIEPTLIIYELPGVAP